MMDQESENQQHKLSHSSLNEPPQSPPDTRLDCTTDQSQRLEEGEEGGGGALLVVVNNNNNILLSTK